MYEAYLTRKFDYLLQCDTLNASEISIIYIIYYTRVKIIQHLHLHVFIQTMFVPNAERSPAGSFHECSGMDSIYDR